MIRRTSLLSFVSLKASLVMHETKNYNLLLNTDIYIYIYGLHICTYGLPSLDTQFLYHFVTKVDNP